MRRDGSAGLDDRYLEQHPGLRSGDGGGRMTTSASTPMEPGERSYLSGHRDGYILGVTVVLDRIETGYRRGKGYPPQGYSNYEEHSDWVLDMIYMERGKITQNKDTE